MSAAANRETKEPIPFRLQCYADRRTVESYCSIISSFIQVQVYNFRDAVMVINDLEKVKELQKGHGEWTDSMIGVCTTALHSLHLHLTETQIIYYIYHLFI